MVHHQDMPGEGDGAAQNQQIPLAHDEALPGGNAEEKQPEHRHQDAEPDPFSGIAPKEEPPGDRHQHHIQGGNKAALAGGGGHQTRLLQIGGQAEQEAAQAGGSSQALFSRRGRGAAGRLLPIHKQDHRKQRGAGHQGPDPVKSKGRHIIHADPLGYEGQSPDQGGQKQQQAGAKRTDIHGIERLIPFDTEISGRHRAPGRFRLGRSPAAG